MITIPRSFNHKGKPLLSPGSRLRPTYKQSQPDKDILSTLEKMSDAQIKRHSLLTGLLVNRMKGSVES
jgi:hypothetical protein